MAYSYLDHREILISVFQVFHKNKEMDVLDNEQLQVVDEIFLVD